MKLPHLLCAVPILLFTGLTSEAQEWGRFRGANGSGVSTSTGLPTEFGPDKNLAWRMELAASTSSPVFSDDAIFTTASTPEKLIVVCFEQKDGSQRWMRELDRVHTTKIYPANDSSSPSPVTDGKNVYAFFPELGLVSFDGQGESRWTLPLGPFISFYGMSSSPILASDTLFLQCDQQQGSFLIAVDSNSGKVKWKTERTGLIESWATPLLYPAEDPTTVLVLGTFFVTGYAIETGKETLRLGGIGYGPASSPILDGDRLFVAVKNHGSEPMQTFESVLADFDKNKDTKLTPAEVEGSWIVDHFGWADANKDDCIVAEEWAFIRAGMSNRDYGLVAIDLGEEAGALTAMESWRYKRALPDIASPLLYEGVVYMVKSGGVVTGVSASPGQVLKSGRIRDGGSEFYPSPIAAEGRVYIASNAGEVTVLRAGDEWEVLSVHELGEEIQASPAIVDGALFVRTQAALYCFRQEATR